MSELTDAEREELYDWWHRPSYTTSLEALPALHVVVERILTAHIAAQHEPRESRIFVGRRYSNQSVTDGSWAEWPGKPFEEVVDLMVERVRDGKANSQGMEVVEVTVTRRVLIKPSVAPVTVEGDAE